MLNTLVELLFFLLKRKKIWMIPIVLVLVTIASLLVIAQGSVVAPFIYTLF